MPAISKSQPPRDHRFVFGLELALGLCGLLAIGLAVGSAAGSVHRQSSGGREILIGGQHFTYPTVNVAAAVLLALAAFGLIVLAIAARATWRQLSAYRRLVRGIPIVGPLPGSSGVTVIDDPNPQAFCAGYLRPNIYISAGALELLSEDELSAVLTHEEHHRAVRDPFRFAFAHVLTQALFFLPALRPLGDRYREIAEQRADEAAVRGSAGEKGPLAAALLAFEAAEPPGAAGITPARVDSLLGRTNTWSLPSFLIVASLAVLSAIIVLAWRASEVASADATFNLPVLSSQPCMLVLAMLPILVCAAALAIRRGPGPASF